jgi:hypothetical protein
MAERILDHRGGVCEQCGQEFQILARHWSQNQSCEFRSLSDHQREIVRGLLLGDGSLDANDLTYLRVSSTRQSHIEWLANELGWLSRGVTYDSSEAYRLRTMSHPNLGRYWTWMEAPSTGYTLTPTAARIWYACDGTLSFAGSSDVPQITFAAKADKKRLALKDLLAHRGFDPLLWERRVALPREQTKQWLSWLGEPTPGSEYKWCTDEPQYRQLRTNEQ